MVCCIGRFQRDKVSTNSPQLEVAKISRLFISIVYVRTHHLFINIKMRLATVSLTALILGVSASPVNQVPVINQAPFSNPRTPEAQTPEAFDGAPLPPKIDTVIGAVIRGHGYDQPKGCHNLDNSTAYEMPIGVCYHFPGQNAEVLVQHCGVCM